MVRRLERRHPLAVKAKAGLAAQVTTILMIYEADSGLMNALLDTLHKVASPSTYPCRLCALTYGLLGMKRAWAETVAGLPFPVEFLHRDEWKERYPETPMALPAILLLSDEGVERLVSASDFEELTTLSALQAKLIARLMPF
jgi:hypothetical protein